MTHKVLPRVPREGPTARWYADLEEAIRHYTVTINPASVAANTTAEQTFTVLGIRSNDFILVNKPSLTAGVGIAGSRATAKDTVGITFVNATAGAIDPGSEDYSIIAIRG